MGIKDIPRPQVGVGVMIFKGQKVLLGKRKGSHGEGEYAFPGGYLEFRESFEECAIRETREETGVGIVDVKFLFAANIMRYSGKHYVHIGLTAKWKSGEPKVLEPDKSENWGWYSLDEPPQPLFEPCELSYKSYKTGGNFFDSK